MVEEIIGALGPAVGALLTTGVLALANPRKRAQQRIEQIIDLANKLPEGSPARSSLEQMAGDDARQWADRFKRNSLLPGSVRWAFYFLVAYTVWTVLTFMVVQFGLWAIGDRPDDPLWVMVLDQLLIVLIIVSVVRLALFAVQFAWKHLSGAITQLWQRNPSRYIGHEQREDPPQQPRTRPNDPSTQRPPDQGPAAGPAGT